MSDELSWNLMAQKMELIDQLRAEIARLQEAKRRALAIADERGNENVGLRAQNDRLRAALQTAQAFMPILRREMPHQESLEQAHKMVADALSQRAD